MSKKGIVHVFIADANWGMLKRDIELSRHFANCKKERGAPSIVYYSAAKNSPDRVTEITEIFQKAQIVASQPVSMQTLDEQTLMTIERQNIKRSAYESLRQRLTDLNINSYIELIWPLPGETLSSFKAGIRELCRMGSETIIVYPNLLLHNTPLYKKREELGLITRKVDDGISEAEIVIGTSGVTTEDFEDGMRIFYALHLLHNARALRTVTRYLADEGIATPDEVFSDFADYARQSNYFPTAAFVEQSVQSAECYDLFNYGKFIHFALHAERASVSELLRQFMTSRPWWSDPNVRFLFELDQLAMPHIYRSAPPGGDHPFEVIQVQSTDARKYDIRIPQQFHSLFLKHAGLPSAMSGTQRYRVDHNRTQYPFMKSQTLDHNAGYCHGMMLRMNKILPQWTAI